MLTHKELRTRALERPDVKSEYDRLDDEFSFLDEFLKARSSAGITQAEVAQRSRLELRLINETEARKSEGQNHALHWTR